MTKQPDHKIVCWADYAIPVPVEANWMAMDDNRRWYFYKAKPIVGNSMWHFSGDNYDANHGMFALASPPQPGPWHEQLYWIGD